MTKLGKLRVAGTLAFHASWRYVLTMFLIMVTIIGPTFLLLGAVFGYLIIVLGIVFIISFPFSMFAHEFGHAFPAINELERMKSGSAADQILARGTWFSSEISRPMFGARRDIIVTVCGPLAGASVGLFVLGFAALLNGGFHVTLLFLLLPFSCHLLDFSRFSKDGRALRAALVREGCVW